MDHVFLFLMAASEKIDPSSVGLDPVKNADGAVAGLLSAVYAGAGMLCVVIIVIAGHLYTTSSGDQANLKRAKEAILGSITGLVVVIMAFVITQFVLGRF
jgi:type IV secretion system pilin